MTEVYGWTVGKLAADQRDRALGLRRPAGPDLLDASSTAPTGFIPQQDQGRLIVSVQLPDSASLQRTQEAMAQVERDRPGDAGRGAHGRHRGDVVPAAGQRVQLRLDVHRPRPVRRAAGARAARRRHHGPAAQASSASRSRMRWSRVRNSSPIPGLGVAGGFKLMVEDRGGRGLEDLQEQTDELVDGDEARAGPGRPRPPSSARTRRSSTWTSTGPRPRPWACRSTT